MAKVVITSVADADSADIVADIAREAGERVAIDYGAKFERLYDHLAAFPESGSPRPQFGAHIRIGVVYPYVVVYRHERGDHTVTIVRIIHGHRNITRRMLRAGRGTSH